MDITAHLIAIILGLIAIGLIFWFRRDQEMTNALVDSDLQASLHGYNALMDDFNHYQVETDRKIAELEKQLEIKIKNHSKRMDKAQKELPSVIGRVVGQIELAQDTINRQM